MKCQYMLVKRTLHEKQHEPCPNPATVVLGTVYLCERCRDRALADRQKSHGRVYYGEVRMSVGNP